MTIKAPDPISFVLLHRCLNCLSPAFSQPESRPLHLYFLVCTTLRFPIAFVLFIVLLYLYCLSAPFSQPVHCTKINSRPPLNAVFYVLLLNGDAFCPNLSFLSLFSLFVCKIFFAVGFIHLKTPWILQFRKTEPKWKIKFKPFWDDKRKARLNHWI